MIRLENFTLEDNLGRTLIKDINLFIPSGSMILIQGYHSEMPLSDKEIKSLPLLAQAAALRFLLTRLYDWFNTSDDAIITKKNPIEYLHKLRFFRNNLIVRYNDLIVI